MDLNKIAERVAAAKPKVSQEEIIQFFVDNPNPDDGKVHAFADKKKISPHDLETEIYKLATIASEFLNDGRSNAKGVTEKDVDAKELKMGIEIESEHTPNKEITKRIALDHLAEMPDYYTKLKKMESEGEKK